MIVSAQLRSLVVADSPMQLVIGNLGAAALSLLSAPIVARALGPVGRGETAAAIALFFIVPVVLAFGVPLEVRRLAAESDGKAALRSARMFCAAGILLSVPLAAASYVTIFAGFDHEARIVAALGIASCPLVMSWMCDTSVLIAHCRYRAVLLVRIAYPAIYVLLVVLLWVLGRATTATVLAANIMGTFGTFGVGLLLTRTSLRGPHHSFRALRRGAVRYAGSAIAESASSRLDQVLVLPLLGAAQAGIYSVAVTVATAPLALGQALGASYFPLIARAEGAARTELKGQAARAGIALALLAAPALGVVAFFAIPVVFGDEFTPAVRVTWMSLIGGGAMLAAYVCSMVLAAEGKGIAMTVGQIVALVTGIGLLYLVAPHFGAIGAAAASSISYLLLLTVLAFSLGIAGRQIVPCAADFRESVARLFRRG